MKKAEVKVGTTYVMNHSSGRIPVRINHEKTSTHFGSNRTTTRWVGTNLKTGRSIEIKSAAKLLHPIPASQPA